MRCCSDKPKDGWKTPEGSCTVWSLTPDSCDEVNWLDAETKCYSSGGRLCTKEELEADCTAGTGCGFDTKFVWAGSSMARDKPTSMSSTPTEEFGAFRAVDGITTGHEPDFAQTEEETDPWWEVHLLNQYHLRKFYVYIRLDCCKERMANWKLDFYNGSTRKASHQTSGVHDIRWIWWTNPAFLNVVDRARMSLSGSGRTLQLTELHMIGPEIGRNDIVDFVHVETVGPLSYFHAKLDNGKVFSVAVSIILHNFAASVFHVSHLAVTKMHFLIVYGIFEFSSKKHAWTLMLLMSLAGASAETGT